MEALETLRSDGSRTQRCRAEIIAAGSRLIAEKGFNAISLQDVLDAAGVTKGKFFHYFHSKDEFFSSLLRETLSSRSLMVFEEVLSGCNSKEPFERLLFLLDKLIEWHTNGLPEVMRLCLFATFFFAPESQELKQIRELLGKNAKTIETLLKQCQQNAVLPETFDPTFVSLMIPSVAVGGSVIGFLSGTDRLTVENLRQTKNILVGLARRDS